MSIVYYSDSVQMKSNDGTGIVQVTDGAIGLKTSTADVSTIETDAVTDNPNAIATSSAIYKTFMPIGSNVIYEDLMSGLTPSEATPLPYKNGLTTSLPAYTYNNTLVKLQFPQAKYGQGYVLVYDIKYLVVMDVDGSSSSTISDGAFKLYFQINYGQYGSSSIPATFAQYTFSNPDINRVYYLTFNWTMISTGTDFEQPLIIANQSPNAMTIKQYGQSSLQSWMIYHITAIPLLTTLYRPALPKVIQLIDCLNGLTFRTQHSSVWTDDVTLPINGLVSGDRLEMMLKLPTAEFEADRYIIHFRLGFYMVIPNYGSDIQVFGSYMRPEYEPVRTTFGAALNYVRVYNTGTVRHFFYGDLNFISSGTDVTINCSFIALVGTTAKPINISSLTFWNNAPYGCPLLEARPIAELVTITYPSE